MWPFSAIKGAMSVFRRRYGNSLSRTGYKKGVCQKSKDFAHPNMIQAGRVMFRQPESNGPGSCVMAVYGKDALQGKGYE